ncbi:6-phosphofructokinase [Achromobacter xylosoxidans]|uniref:6-phosphofructokinase n=1 Tax=Alcaligenes xylosoxydans xylosoxydans TaxID=85698 RepID=UPI000B493E51|nr:6-phosphofructokinase [Achromobacter xylosoxidans]
MSISTRRLSDVLASTESGRLYRIEVFVRREEPARPDAARPDAARYILRTTEGERVLPLDRNRYRLQSGEVLTALAPPPHDA